MNKLIKVAEITIIYSIPELLSGTPQGSLSNKYKKLCKECEKELRKHRCSMQEFNKAKKAVRLFYERTGWIGKKRRTCTLINFILSMIDESKNSFSSAIVSTLNDIFEYYNNKTDVPTLCYSAGVTASEKWERVKEEVFNV